MYQRSSARRVPASPPSPAFQFFEYDTDVLPEPQLVRAGPLPDPPTALAPSGPRPREGEGVSLRLVQPFKHGFQAPSQTKRDSSTPLAERSPLAKLRAPHPRQRENHATLVTHNTVLELPKPSTIWSAFPPSPQLPQAREVPISTVDARFDAFVEDVMAWHQSATAWNPTRLRSHRPKGLTIRESVLQVCTTKDRYKDMLSLEGERAQLWIDGMQSMLDREPVPSRARRNFLKALLRLSKKTGLYPQQLQFSDQVKKDDVPVDEGSFGEVYKGDVAGRRVAIKIFRVDQRMDMQQLMKDIWKEAIIWCQLYHANVLPCYGIYRQPNQQNRIGLISPWIENGNVVDYLLRYPSANRLLLLSDIASGMAYLHENNIVHGDLKGANILISSSGRACLADFGLSRVADSAMLVWTSVRTTTDRAAGTTRWQAPELLSPDDDHDANLRATTASDVYSYGCVCYEVMTGKTPFYEIKNNTAVFLKVRGGSRPKKPDPGDPAFEKFGLEEDIWIFVETCWVADPVARPSAEKLKESHLFALSDPRPVQNWGGGSAAEFRRRASPLWESRYGPTSSVYDPARRLTLRTPESLLSDPPFALRAMR